MHAGRGGRAGFGRALVIAALGLAWPSPGLAQQPFNVAVQVDQLSLIFAELFGPEGLLVDSLALLPGETAHTAHFNSAFESDFSQFSTALTSQLVSVPLPSPASGFTYRFDPGLGVFTRTTQSFGPILGERIETIGAQQASFGFSFQRFNFDTIEGLDLNRVPAVFTHDNFELRGGREDVVTTVNRIQATVNQFTAFLTYGLTETLDLSVAVPIVNTDLLVVSEANVQRIGTVNPQTHFFRSVDGQVGERRLFTAFGTASGIGDVTVRLKRTLQKRERMGFAAGLNIRLPTGDDENLLGTGAAGVEAFGVWSATYGVFSPHVNAGYQWNGSSPLAAAPGSGESKDLPDQISYIAGADFGVTPRVTFAFDLLGRFLIDSPRLVQTSFRALDGVSVFPNVAFVTESFAELNGAVGVKLNLVGRLLLDLNLLFALDDSGLRDKVTPLMGLEYAF